MSSAPSFFKGASHMQFYGGQSFTNANNIINNFNSYSARAEFEPGPSSSHRDDDKWLTLHGGQRLRRIDMCDVLILREVSSETLCVSVKLKSTNPFRNRMGGVGVVKFRKRVQNAEIVEFGDRRFSVVSLEPEDDGDVEKIRMVLEPLYATALSQRRVWLTQLFGVGRSMTPTLIYHDEVVDVNTIARQYMKVPIVWMYLAYKLWNSVLDVQNDGTLQKLSIQLVTENWMFNLRTGSFQCDVINSALSGEDDSRRFFEWLPPLPRGCNPPLNSNEIIRALPDFLQMVSSYGGQRRIALFHHDALTFGAVVDRREPGILTYFPSIPSPVWSCEPSVGTTGIVANYSESGTNPFLRVFLNPNHFTVPSLVDLTFEKNDNEWEIAIRFSLRLPEDQRFRAAYLAQSLPLYKDYCLDSDELVFVNSLDFRLTGTFRSDPSSCNPPKYLHVPPLSPEWIDNMPCLRWRSNTRLFYWSFDRGGRMEIEKDDWKKYGIPTLEVDTFIGSAWEGWEYRAVEEYLHLKKYDLGGQQFANDHGYPILIKGNPHMQMKTII
ncbi:hypothetical protein E1B28_010542 [Marasmius oreades]|uniref:Uncharacterized protein n=1 Tax=Marasmius oreades TaxID=181124 RepID=A0A9P7RXG5_9AGAR|nr:uncharacterized protein E1B28_010542 [Marasmius oreades]KAG7091514.1 hypothetical protein E1B28_010542 [Marasmius oreades]